MVTVFSSGRSPGRARPSPTSRCSPCARCHRAHRLDVEFPFRQAWPGAGATDARVGPSERPGLHDADRSPEGLSRLCAHHGLSGSGARRSSGTGAPSAPEKARRSSVSADRRVLMVRHRTLCDRNDHRTRQPLHTAGASPSVGGLGREGLREERPCPGRAGAVAMSTALKEEHLQGEHHRVVSAGAGRCRTGVRGRAGGWGVADRDGPRHRPGPGSFCGLGAGAAPVGAA